MKISYTVKLDPSTKDYVIQTQVDDNKPKLVTDSGKFYGAYRAFKTLKGATKFAQKDANNKADMFKAQTDITTDLTAAIIF